MENQDGVDYADLLQIHVYIRKKIGQQKNQTKITDFVIKLLQKECLVFLYVLQCADMYKFLFCLHG
jgi:hypothetical protein